MSIKGIDDLNKGDKDKAIKETREKISSFLEGVTDDIEDLAKRKKIEKEKKEKESKTPIRNIFKFILIFIFLLALGLFTINFLLANIWLIKFFIKTLFGT